MGGFLTTLCRGLVDEAGAPVVESAAMPGMPPQVICYERADDIGFGVSGVVSRARGIRTSFPGFDPAMVPMCTRVREERSRICWTRSGSAAGRGWCVLNYRMIRRRGEKAARNSPTRRWSCREYSARFLAKHDGIRIFPGQFNTVGGWRDHGLGAGPESGRPRPWPGRSWRMARMCGLRLADQGRGQKGRPDADIMPAWTCAPQTVVGDGPDGPVGLGHRRYFSGCRVGIIAGNGPLGMKQVVICRKAAHSPRARCCTPSANREPEIFGVPVTCCRTGGVAWASSCPPGSTTPARTAYRYLQHWMRHPYLWRILEGWPAAVLRGQEPFGVPGGGEPFLVGDGKPANRRGLGLDQRAHGLGRGRGLDDRGATGRGRA